MFFRLPFQICRTALKGSKFFTKQCKAQELLRILSKREYPPIVDENNNAFAQLSITKRYLTTNRFIHKRTNLENRKKVRKNSKCNCPKKCQKKLAFRQTTLEECCNCVDPIRKPLFDPGLHPLKPEYDPSKQKWKHVCPEDICAKVVRMDDVVGYKVLEKELPKIKSDCKPCTAFKPTKAPKLGRLRQKYDPSSMKWKHPICKRFCKAAERMDDVCGYKVKDKKLPKLPEGIDCRPCLDKPPRKAPKLSRPIKKYDPAKMKWNHPPCPKPCKNAPRMDVILGYKIEKKKLPKIPISDCNPCIDAPKTAPKLKRPIKLYDDKKFKWVHPPCKDFCDDAQRIDDFCYKVVPKCLPKIKSDCIECLPPVPRILPELNRPLKKYDDSKMEKKYDCPIDEICRNPKRSDEGLKIMKKKLPKLATLTNDCEPCADIPTECPKLTRLLKAYDDKKLKWVHTCCVDDDCNVHPPKSDVVNGYKIEKKKLKKYIPADTCKPCLPFKPTKAPELSRPEMLYDPRLLNPDRICPKDTCNIDPPRMDNVMKLKVKEKVLPKLTMDKCPPCIDSAPKYAPELVPPKRKYNPNTMKKEWHCPDFCDDSVRMDDVMGYKVTPKTLPILPSMDNCEPCIQPPKYAPKLRRPKRKYDPIDEPCREEIDLCDLDPPRMDDVLCWKPKKKILPSMNSDSHSQCKHFSTLAIPRITLTKHSYKNRIIRMYGTKSGKGKKTDSTKKQGCIKKANFQECNKTSPPVCKKPECKNIKEPTKEPVKKRCIVFHVCPCEPRARQLCVEEDDICKRIEPPYDAFGDVCGSGYVDPVTECIDNGEVLLQPQKQVGNKIHLIKPPTLSPVDPERERKCLEEREPDPDPLPDDKCWQNPCFKIKVCPCKGRSREFCNDNIEKCCNKLHAPYKSFSDQCPNFPKVDESECRVAEKMKDSYMVSFKNKNPKDPDCKKKKNRKKVDRTVRCGTKINDINEDRTCEKIVIPTWADKRVSCKKPHRSRVPKSDKCKIAKAPGGKCCQKKSTPKKQPSKCSKLASTLKKSEVKHKTKKPPRQPPGPKSCKTKPQNCKQPESRCPESNKCKKDLSNQKLNECGRPKSKDSSPNPKYIGNKRGKCGGGSKKSNCSGEYTGSKILKGQSQPRIQEPITNSAVLNFSTLAIPLKTPKSIWEKVCECFLPKPGAAGLQICEPSCSYVTVDLEKCAHKLTPNLIQTHETDTNTFCPPSECEPKQNMSNPEIKKLDLEHPKFENSESCLPHEHESLSDAVDSPILKTQNCFSKPTVDSTLNRRNIKTMKNAYKIKSSLSHVSKNRYFTTYSRFSTKKKHNLSEITMKKTNDLSTTSLKSITSDKYEQMLTKQSPYLRLNNNYIGRIYKLKLRKIGVQNKFVQKYNEEPYTICHSCKVVPRHETILNPLLRHVQILKSTKVK